MKQAQLSELLMLMTRLNKLDIIMKDVLQLVT